MVFKYSSSRCDVSHVTLVGTPDASEFAFTLETGDANKPSKSNQGTASEGVCNTSCFQFFLLLIWRNLWRIELAPESVCHMMVRPESTYSFTLQVEFRFFCVRSIPSERLP